MIYQNEDFIYDSETGGMIHARDKRNGSIKKYSPLSIKPNTTTGYLSCNIIGKGSHVGQHRIAWFLVHGYWPKEIDHINGARTDNRLCNLREVDRITQRRNQKLGSNNTSGLHGVYWHKNQKKWFAAIKINNVLKHLGSFKNFFEACCARKSAEAKYNFHPNHGRTE